MRIKMRVTSGEYKGRRISAGRKMKIRPTSDRVKESIFDTLRGEIEGKRVLDLFAGAGSLGIEALSQGALSVTFVDSSSASINVLKRNLDDLKLRDKASILRLDGLKALHKLDSVYQIIFSDPPYLKNFAQKIVNQVAISGVLETGGILVLEHHKKEAVTFPEEKWILLKERKFGDTLVSFLLKKS
jgi:16S rRNA (guanine966-N2)-methyltransferase